MRNNIVTSSSVTHVSLVLNDFKSKRRTKHIEKWKQESRAVAWRPRDAAIIKFCLTNGENISVQYRAPQSIAR